MRSALTLAILLTLTFAAPAQARTIAGPARVIDGDTVVVGAVHVRLKGVDAAEMNTAIGRRAREVMVMIVGNSILTCELTGERTYRREVGYCRTSSGLDIGRAIIERGAALACARYSTRYVEFEQPDAMQQQRRAPYCGNPSPAITPKPTPPPSPPVADPVPVPRPPLLQPGVKYNPSSGAPEGDVGFAWFMLIMIIVVLFGVFRFTGTVAVPFIGWVLFGSRRRRW